MKLQVWAIHPCTYTCVYMYLHIILFYFISFSVFITSLEHEAWFYAVLHIFRWKTNTFPFFIWHQYDASITIVGEHLVILFGWHHYHLSAPFRIQMLNISGATRTRRRPSPSISRYIFLYRLLLIYHWPHIEVYYTQLFNGYPIRICYY